MADKIFEIQTVCCQELEKCDSLQALQDLRVRYLGKSGELTALLKAVHLPRSLTRSRRACLTAMSRARTTTATFLTPFTTTT